MMRWNRWTVVPIQGLILGLLAWHARTVNYVVDDSFISFRYAQHLVEGHGLVYNIGERVEGYTNFLWVILLAGAKLLLPFLELPLLASTMGLAFALITVVLVFRLSVLVSGRRETGWLAGLFLAAHSGLVAWSTAGLETPLFTLLVLGGAIAYVRHLHLGRGVLMVPVWFALAALARADGALFFAATLLAVVAVEVKRSGWAGLRLPLGLAAIFCAIYLPQILWRYSYYGEFVPNTAFAKVGGGWLHLTRGLRYVWSYIVGYGVFLWVLPVVMYLWRSREVWVWYLVWLISTWLVYVVYVGGDGLGFDRFIVPVAPLIYFVLAVSLVDGYRRHIQPLAAAPLRSVGAAVVVACLLVATARTSVEPVVFPERVRWFEPQSGLSFPGNGREHSYRWFINYFVDRLTIAARYLDRNAPANSLVASTPAGAIGYYMNHRVIDMLGLTDKHIARTQDLFWVGRAGHEKGDGQYVLSRSPDYILMGNVAVLSYPLTEETMATKLVDKSEYELWADPEFHRRYELVSVRLATSGPFQYFTFYRKKPS